MLTKDSTIIILISLLILIASIPYIMKPTIYEGVDTAYHMSRMVGMTNSWKQGDFLAFIHLDTAGYGYAIGFFYSNLFLIIPSMFYLLGINVITIYKVFLVVCTILSAIAMYITTKRIAKSKYAAIIATIVCTNSCIKTLQDYRNTQDKEKIKIDEHFTYNICDGVYLPEGAIHPYQYRELEQEEMQTIKEKVVTNYKELDYEIQKDGLTIQLSFKNNQAKDTYIEVPMHYYYGYVAKVFDYYFTCNIFVLGLS